MPYPFEKVNYQPEIITYTSEEYDSLLKDLNPGWSKEETDYLWTLLKQYDLWFIVIQDWYSFNSKDRSIEEIKNWYYSCAKALLEAWGNIEHPICQKPYNFEYEVWWKYNLDKLFLWTKSQHESEKKIVEDIKKIDSRIKKLEKEERALNKFL